MSRSQEGKMTFTAGAALLANRRVKIKAATATSPPEVEYAGAGEQHIGVTEIDASSGGLVTVRPRNMPGSAQVAAAGAFAIGATLYGAATGLVDDAVSGTALGLALEAAGAAGDEVECIFDNGGF